MAKGLVNESSLNSIGTAINVLNGTEGTYYPSEMGEAIIDAIPTETASGNPIHITDAAAYPVESVVTTLEPVQDLHGYSKPWPAGGGKNVWKGIVVTSNTFLESFALPSGMRTFTISLDNDSNSQVNGVVYNINGTKIVGDFEIALANASGTVTKTISEDGYLGLYVINQQATAASNVKNIQVESGSTATPYEPYSNICPISGHTGVELTRTGKNLFATNNLPIIAQDGITIELTDDGGIRVHGTPTYSSGFKAFSIGSPPTLLFNKRCALSTNRKDMGIGIAVGDGSINLTMAESYTKRRGTLANVSDCIFNISYDVGTIDNTYYIQLEEGDAYTTFEPYTLETHSITFPQEQSPVYGGEVDWVQGVLRVTKVAFTATNFSDWIYQTYENFKALYIPLSILGLPECDVNKRADTLFDKFKTVLVGTAQPFGTASMYTTNGKSIVYFWDNDLFYADEASMKQGMTAIGGVQFCYTLATPIEIPLTPEVITLLKGENNIWTDAGTSEIGYKVDLQSYIQKLIDEASAH